MAKNSGDDVPRLMVNDSDNTSTGWSISQFSKTSKLKPFKVGDLDEGGPKRREIRLRRCPSTSKVETIVTEDEKLRRAQPDKP